MNKNKLVSLFLTTLIPCYSYSNNQIDNGSTRLEDNNGISKIILDQTDSNAVLGADKNLIPQSNGSNILENNVTHVTGTPAGTVGIYGGYCSNSTSCIVNNTPLS